MLRRIVSTGLSLVLVLSLMLGFAGCGKRQTTIKWATEFADQVDSSKVLEVANKRLEELLPGAKIEYVPLNKTTWSSQMASGEQIDIAWTGFGINIKSEIQNGSYMALNELITEEDTPNLYKEWQDYKADYETAMVDGKLYAIPNQQPLISQSPYLRIPESLMQYFDVDAFLKATYASTTTTREVYEVLDDYFEKVWANNAYDTDMVNDSIDMKNLYDFLAMRGMENAGGNVVYDAFADEVKLQNSFETEQYQLFMEYAAKWYQAGYISEKILVNTGATGSRLSVLSAHGNGNFYKLDDEERGIRKVYDSDGYLEEYHVNMEPSDLSQQVCSTQKLGAEQTYLAIPYTCANPKLTIKLLDLLRSPIGTEGNDLLNLLVYGFEKNSKEAEEYGVYHYTLEGKDLAIGNGYTVQPSTSSPYGIPHWVMGNVFLTYRTPNILEGQNDFAKRYEQEQLPNLHKTPLYGFVCDLDAYKTQQGNINAVIEEYNSRLYCGVDGADYMKTYDAFISKLRIAGLTEVFNEVNKQVNSFLAQK